MLELLVFLVVGLAIGFLTGMVFGRSKRAAGEGEDAAGAALREELRRLQMEKEKVAVEKGELEGRLHKSIEVFDEQKKVLKERDEDLLRLSGNVERLEAEKKALEEKLAEHMQETEKLNQKFKTEFQNLANEILKQNTREFTESNRKQIGDILNPLKEKIEGFEKRVNEVYSTESSSRSELMGQVKSLMELNRKISEEANNLTNALRGDTRKQGAWGEFILEKILESSGLEKGVEYETQVFSRTEEGVFRPDVIVHLPDEKYIVIDSKVSLVAFEAYANSEQPEERLRYLQQHIGSIRQHVKGLSGKNYQLKVQGESLDFVLMFVPIEAGFAEALRNDRELYSYAWDNRIVIVSPTTLLATLRTIASVWKQEKQNRNVQEIARLAGGMYDKFHGFVEDLQRIDRHLMQTKGAYEDAMSKLYTGKDNLLRKAERVKALGAKTSKDLPSQLIDQSEPD